MYTVNMLKKIILTAIIGYLSIGILFSGNEWRKDLATFDCAGFGYGGGSIFEPASPGCVRRGLQVEYIFSVLVLAVLWGPLVIPRIVFPESTEEVL